MNESEKALNEMYRLLGKIPYEVELSALNPIRKLVDRDLPMKIQYVGKLPTGSVFHCPSCYWQVGTSANFCKHCGQRLGSVDDE